MKTIIKTNDICKNYGKVIALDNINIEVNEGEIFGLIGPDGAGKTSLIRILTTLILADKGTAQVLDLDIVRDYKSIRQKIGYMPGKFSLYQDLTVMENLRLFATIFGTTIEENYELIKPIYSQIEEFKDRPAGKLSGGMKQKLALSCAMIHRPELLILDEPTTGVDPVSRKEFWDMLKELRDFGIAIFVSTPYMDEASLCDRVALIQSGKILSISTPEKIVGLFPHKLFSIISNNMHKLIKALREYKYQNSVFTFGESVHYTDIRSDISIYKELVTYLEKMGLRNITITEITANIEDCFMDLMVKNENN